MLNKGAIKTMHFVNSYHYILSMGKAIAKSQFLLDQLHNGYIRNCAGGERSHDVTPLHMTSHPPMLLPSSCLCGQTQPPEHTGSCCSAAVAMAEFL